MTIDYDRDQLSYALANALKERDEAREAFVIATDQMVIAQGKVREANKERDEARKEIEGWKNKWECAVEMAARAENECEEQAKLLAMSAEREADLLGKLDRIERAANNVILQWDLPSWKLTEPTAGVIYRLRNALGMGE
jgi:hypothetical protein